MDVAGGTKTNSSKGTSSAVLGSPGGRNSAEGEHEKWPALKKKARSENGRFGALEVKGGKRVESC